ncbi:MAG: hypothetical protein Q7T52_15200, partial [Nocardioides sp.]|nr:hypothetical protein [Nocardioides sp.]
APSYAVPPPVPSSAPPPTAPPPYVPPPIAPPAAEPATPPSARPSVPTGPQRTHGKPPARPVERLRPPSVSTETTEVTVAPAAPGTFPLVVRNGSTIVDSYTIAIVDPPPWLTIEHGDTNLLPDESRPVQVTLAVRPGSLAVAQRLSVVARVASEVDPVRAADVPLVLVVPRAGPDATLTSHPSLVRLQDSGRGTFVVRVDNRGSNHPRSYRMAASDPEGVVAVEFGPSVVDVAAGAVAETTVRFVAPEPAAGADASRQLTVTATDEAGSPATQVTVAQSTSARLEQPPVKLRLEPSQVVAVDAATARLDVVVDNRAGVEDVVVSLRGQDPAQAVSFAFDHDGFPLQAGRAVRLGMQLSSRPPPRGQSVTRPFTVVASAGGSESEIDGSFELSSRQAAIVTASVRLVPDHLRVSSRHGEFTVEVDNRQGLEPLVVVLSGGDEFGRARLAFAPVQVAVPPGQVGFSTMTISHPKPDGGKAETRRVRVTASDGPSAVHDEAMFTQESSSHFRLWAYLVAILGVVLVALGTVVEVDDTGLDTPEAVVRVIVDDVQSGNTPASEVIRAAVVVAALAFVLLAIVMMLFGLVGTTGRGLRVGGIVAALFGAAAIVALSAEGVGGWALVVAGSAVAFVGGIMVRASRS